MNKQELCRIDHIKDPPLIIPIKQFGIHIFPYHLHSRFLWLSIRTFNLFYTNRLPLNFVKEQFY